MSDLRFGKIQSVCFAIIVIGLGGFYVSQPDRLRSTLGPAYSIGRHENPDWVLFQKEDLQETLDGQRVNYWDLNRTRALLSRWRLRDISSVPYENLLEEYENGWWISPDSEDITRLLEENDARWLAARKEAGVLSLTPDYQANILPGRIDLIFTDPPRISTLGSQITVTLSSSKPFTSDNGMFWSTDFLYQYSIRFRDGISQDLTENGKFGRTIVYDMSWQPGWLAPDARLTELSFPVPQDARWQIESLEFSDSPYLPLPHP